MASLPSFTAVAVLALAAACAACNPIETYRDLRGINRNDPDPATAPFSGNMATADAAPYPNLATVPPPPTRATSTADRQKLTESLITDRTATAAAAAVPTPVAEPAPATPAKPVPAAPKTAASVPAPAAPPTAAPPPLPQVAASPPTAPPPSARAPSEVVAAAPVAPATPPPVAAVAPAAPPLSPVPDAAAAPGKQATNSTQPARRFRGQPVEAPPMDSSLEMPQVRSRPEPEAVRPPLPQPSLAGVVPPAPAAPTPPEALASAIPAPPPPMPALMPLVPPPPTVIGAPPRRGPAATTVATLRLTDPAAAGADRAEIDRVAALYRERLGTVRVLAFAAAPTGGGDPLASYHAALGRAQQIAKALADAGVPANKIQTEAAPSPLAAGRVDIQFAP